MKGDVMRAEQEKLVKRLFEEERFAELEKLAMDIRNRRERFPDGGWKIDAFYKALPQPAKHDALAWKRFLAKVNRWYEAFPHSITARVALAKGYYLWAWDARGGGYVDTVTEEGWAKFEERLARAWALVEKPAGNSDCPERYLVRINVALLLGAPKRQVDVYFEEAMKYEPHYFGFIYTRAAWLIPQWGGAPGEWAQFGLREARRLPTPDRESFPARLAIRVVEKKLPDVDALKWLPWDMLKPAFETLLANYETNMTRNWYLRMACVAKDDSVIRRMSYLLGSDIDSTLWTNKKDFRACLSIPETIEQPPAAMERVNLLTGVTWTPDGEAWSDGKTQHTLNGGKISAKVRFAPRAGGCALVGTKATYKRAHTTITGLPMIRGSLSYGNKIVVNLSTALPAAKQADAVSLWNVYPIPSEINNAIVHLYSASRKGDDPTGNVADFTDATLMFFPTCDDASAVVKKLFQ